MARETFGVENVVARIYDPGRAEVYQRLGIPTVATVKWTSDQMLRRLLPQGHVPELVDPSGNVVIAEVTVNPAWVGQPRQRARGGHRRPRAPTSPGWARAILPDADTVFQEGDLAPPRQPRRRATSPSRRSASSTPRPPPARAALSHEGHPHARRHRRGRQRRPLHRPRAAAQRPPGAAHRPERRGRPGPASVPDANWLLADACEITALHEAGLAECDVVVAATGDDKVNLVVSLLAKTEFGVPRTVARVNNPKNEWMFDEAWGVDVAVSTPRLMTALVEEAVSVGDLVRIFQFQQGKATMVELTLPAEQPVRRQAGRRRRLPRRHGAGRHHPRGPPDRARAATTRSSRTTSCCSSPTPEIEDELEAMLSPGERNPRGEADPSADVGELALGAV